MQGKIIKCVKNIYTVLDQENKIYECTLKGSERLKKTDFANPIAVGDNVDFIDVDKIGKGVIHKILQRKNYVIRQSVNLSYKSQILASNVDLSFLIVTIKNPKTSLKLHFEPPSKMCDFERKNDF